MLNSIDNLKEQHQKEIDKLNKDWEKKLKEAVEAARKEEQGKAQQALDKLKKDYENKAELLNTKIQRLNEEIE